MKARAEKGKFDLGRIKVDKGPSEARAPNKKAHCQAREFLSYISYYYMYYMGHAATKPDKVNI